MSEWWANGPLGLEQGFVVPVRPAGGSGALTLSLGLSGAMRARLDDGSVLLGDGLRYGGLVATDARGRTLPSRLTLSEGRILIEVNDSGARYPVRVDPILQQAELTASAGAAGDFLGSSVAISGDEIVAGAPNHTVGGHANQGAVYVFEGSGSSWAQTAELTASDGAANDQLGHSVAVEGGTIVAGAPYHTVATNGQLGGAAYVFTGSGSSWTQAAELTASNGADGDGLGWSVAISGDEIVAGAPSKAIGAKVEQGAVYVFTGSGSSWTQAAELTASDGAADDFLGDSVAVLADTIVAGAHGHTVGGHGGQGAAYVFIEPARGWMNAHQTAELTASDGADDDAFGYSAAISDTGIVVVGAPNHNVGANPYQGAAYVYVQPATGWVNAHQTAELTASDGADGDGLGWSVAMLGGTVVAGAPNHTVGGHANQGAAYVFAEPASGWANETQTAELTASDGATNDLLGSSVGVSGDTVVAGAPNHTVGGHARQGAAYVFAVPPTISIRSPANLTSYARGEVVHASYTCAVSPPATISSCTGPVADGAPVNTSAGLRTFTVQAIDSAGQTASETVTYLVLIRPHLGGVGQSHNTWREGNKLASISSADKKKPPVGTTFKFTLSEPGTVKLVFTQRVSGRQIKVRGKRKCVAQTRHNKRDRPCKRKVTAGTLKLKAPASRDKIAFDGRISAHHKLAPGIYTVTITATDAVGQKSTPRKLTFTIVR